MTASKRNLVAVELDEASARAILSRAINVVADVDILDVLTVVEATSVGFTADPSMSGEGYLDTYEAAMDAAQVKLAKICKDFDIPSECQHVRYGRVAHEIRRAAAEGYDTLLIGSHGYSGWRNVLGSQAQSILHGLTINTWVFALSDE